MQHLEAFLTGLFRAFKEEDLSLLQYPEECTNTLLRLTECERQPTCAVKEGSMRQIGYLLYYVFKRDLSPGSRLTKQSPRFSRDACSNIIL